MNTMNLNAVSVGVVGKAEEAAPRAQASFRLDGGLLAVAIGLSLWFLCAVVVVATFVHPGLPHRPAAEQVRSAPVPFARLNR